MVLVNSLDDFALALKTKRDALPPLVLMFPGQGAQFSGMLRAVKDDPSVELLLKQANEIMQPLDIVELCLNGEANKLALTENSQPAIYLASMCCLAALKNQRAFDFPKERHVVCAGLSLGEYTALAAAGRISFSEGMKLVKTRSEAMANAANSRAGRMVSVVGWREAAEVEELCITAREGKQGFIGIANYLFTGGCAISGDTPIIESFLEIVRERKPEWKVSLLATSGAFHCSHMAPAARALGKALGDMSIGAGSQNWEVYSNVTAMPHSFDGRAVADRLAEQLTSPVQWAASMENILRSFEDCREPEVIELGPGRQLSAMLRRINPEVAKRVQCIPV